MAGSYKIEKIGSPTILTASVSESAYSVISLDLAQSRHFRIAIDGIETTPTQRDNLNGYLSLKNITLSQVGIEVTTFALGVFKDIPLPTGRRLPKITLTIVDDFNDTLEKQFLKWYEEVIPSNGGYVGYLDDLIRDFKYESYSPDGKKVRSFRTSVMLVDDMMMTRDYETNDFKTFQVDLILLGTTN